MKTIKPADKKAINILSLGHFAVDLYASCLVPLYPYIVQKLGINLAIISIIVSIGHLTSSMMQPLFGFLADKTRHRFYMFWGLFLGALFIPLAANANSVWLLAMFLILGVGGNALFHPQVTTMITAFSYENKDLTKYMGIFMGLGTIGYALGPICSTTIVKNFGESKLPYISLIGILAAFLMYFVVPKIPLRSLRKSKDSFLGIMKEILSSAKMVNLTWISIVKSIVSISFGTYMPFLLTKLGYTLEQIGLFITLFFTFAGIASMLSEKLEKIIGAKSVIRISFLAILPLTALFLWLFTVNKHLGLLVFMITGFFVFLSVSVTIVLAQRFMPQHKGVISGVIGGFSWGLAALTLAPLGFIAQKFGIEIILITVSVLAFLTGIFCVSDFLNE